MKPKTKSILILLLIAAMVCTMTGCSEKPREVAAIGPDRSQNSQIFTSQFLTPENDYVELTASSYSCAVVTITALLEYLAAGFDSEELNIMDSMVGLVPETGAIDVLIAKTNGEQYVNLCFYTSGEFTLNEYDMAEVKASEKYKAYQINIATDLFNASEEIQSAFIEK